MLRYEVQNRTTPQAAQRQDDKRLYRDPKVLANDTL